MPDPSAPNVAALILAAGYATRMYPLTSDRPKALLPVAGKPILDYLLEGISHVREVEASDGVVHG